MASYAKQAALSAAILKASPAWAELCARSEDTDDDLLAAIGESAAQFAAEVLQPLNEISDREGVTLSPGGRVITPDAYKNAWAQMAEGGWLGTDVPAAHGGMGLPLTVHTVAQTLFDRAAMAFGMLPGSSRCAAMVLSTFADAETRDKWVPALAAGERSATICISEADAGSDLGRVRTKAVEDEADGWRISGEKCWISYGDHDLTEIVGHMVLARTGRAESGTRGLSLFLVPSVRGDGSRNVDVVRIEEKLGLHGSPTCVLSFSDAKAILIGEKERGLPQLFVMIERMRLLTAGQGLGLGYGSLENALKYSRDRKQGGRPENAPPAIISHPDVQRQLADMAAQIYVLHALVLEVALLIDLSKSDRGDLEAFSRQQLAAFLLPLAKNFGGKVGFDLADRAMQIFGGAGYTKEWPVEQTLRDARILTIYEGTTGMQALDLMHRRLWKDERAGYNVFVAQFEGEIEKVAAIESVMADKGAKALEMLNALVDQFAALQNDPVTANYGADALFNAMWAGVSAWMALRLINNEDKFGGDAAEVVGAARLRLDQALIEIASETARAQLAVDDIIAASGVNEA